MSKVEAKQAINEIERLFHEKTNQAIIKDDLIIISNIHTIKTFVEHSPRFECKYIENLKTIFIISLFLGFFLLSLYSYIDYRKFIYLSKNDIQTIIENKQCITNFDNLIRYSENNKVVESEENNKKLAVLQAKDCTNKLKNITESLENLHK